ncbi:hypothetical protein DL764_007544 [Monosporascus ibericus]|uniref:Uncharacterized protein n=1 Tax=Monosporascus ibericus TaxID=155417 RepID=A0A4Q4T013_9PEZI|nr:hypothetical protein DL764_007544 [Monosporascus ibericus]
MRAPSAPTQGVSIQEHVLSVSALTPVMLWKSAAQARAFPVEGRGHAEQEAGLEDARAILAVLGHPLDLGQAADSILLGVSQSRGYPDVDEGAVSDPSLVRHPVAFLRVVKVGTAEDPGVLGESCAQDGSTTPVLSLLTTGCLLSV